MGRNKPVSQEVVRLVFQLRYDGWNLREIGSHFSKSRQWATHIIANYSEESLSPNVVRKFGRRRKTDEVEDGVIVGMGKFFVRRILRQAAVINDENICPDIKTEVSKPLVFRRCKELGARSVRPIPDQLTSEHKRLRVEFARKHLDILLQDPNFFFKVLFSDEVRFDLAPCTLQV